jgi:hypothetical protein
MAITEGFVQTVAGLQILKDPEAQLTYTLDWVDWLPTGDELSTVDWTITARANDPDPVQEVSSGITEDTKTYIELSDGVAGKTYTITAKVTTVDGLIDRRFFKVKVANRSA